MEPPEKRSGDWLALSEEFKRIQAEAFGDALEGAEGEVALAAFDAAHVGPVDAEHISEGLLAEALGLQVLEEALPDDALEVAFHGPPA